MFESGIKALKAKGIADFPLGPIIIDGVFHKYMDGETDSAWIGFQLAHNVFCRGKEAVVQPDNVSMDLAVLTEAQRDHNAAVYHGAVHGELEKFERFHPANTAAEDMNKLRALLESEFECYRTVAGIIPWAINALLDNSPHRMDRPGIINGVGFEQMFIDTRKPN